MTPTEQRIAIAEACGWFKYCVNSLKEQVWHKKIESKYADTAVAGFEELPDYLNDLNAMHEAEQRFTKLACGLSTNTADIKSDYFRYQFELAKVTHAGRNDRGPLAIICATAAQRAEAFLRTLNLWKE